MNCEWKGKPPSKELLKYLYNIKTYKPHIFDSDAELIRHFYTFPQTLLDSYNHKVLVVVDYTQMNYYWELKGWYLVEKTLYERLNRDNPTLHFTTSDDVVWSIHWTDTAEPYDHTACKCNPLTHMEGESLVSRALTDPQEIAEYIKTTELDELDVEMEFALDEYLHVKR